ncbi:hypothetical protein M9458_023823, partial [Cirrhinus mrigala]
MDPLFHPEYLLLLLEQGERSLEGHTTLFLVLTSLTTYPDDMLCAFYNASLNITCRAPLFAAFVEWILVRNGSPFPVCSLEKLTSSTPKPVPSPPSPSGAEHQPEPTNDGESEPAVTVEPSAQGATELRTAAEPELRVPSDQVREPATTPATRQKAMASEIAESSSTHCNMAECECFNGPGYKESRPNRLPSVTPVPTLAQKGLLFLSQALRKTISKSNPKRDSIPKSCPERISISESQKSQNCSPSYSFLPPPLSSALHLCSRLAVGLQVTIGDTVGGSLSPPPASESRTPPRPIDPAAPPWLLAPSSLPWPGSPLAPPGSLVHPAPLWSGVNQPAPLDSTLPAAPPSLQLHPGPLSLRFHHGLLDPHLCISRRSLMFQLGPPDPPRHPGSSALHLRLGLLCHLLHRHRSAPWSRPPFLLHGFFLLWLHHSPTWLLLLQVPPVSVSSTLVPP